MGKGKKENPLWVRTGHSKPVSRRDFLSAGVIPFAVQLAVPNWLSLILGPNASAAENTCPVPESLIPFITINLTGGAAMAANFVPMNKDRQLLSSYNLLGLGNNQLPIEREFGNVPFAGMVDGRLVSQFLAGIRTPAQADTLGKTAFVGIPCDNLSDSVFNKFDISGAVTRAGLVGKFLPNIGGTYSLTGISQASAIVKPVAPLVVGSYSTLTSSVGYSAALGRYLNPNQRIALAKLVGNLTASQSKKLGTAKGIEEISSTLNCAATKNTELLKQGSAFVDPRQNASYASVWNLTPQSSDFDLDLVIGSMVYNTLLGQAGACGIELGGFDYHDDTRTTGDAADHRAGVVVGRILQGAAALGKPVFIYIVSDGSVSSAVSEGRGAPWRSDSGSNGLAYMLYFDPKGRPETSDFQIGQFTDNQAADTTFLTGGDAEITAAAVFANWCQANKRNDLFTKVADNFLSTKQLGQVIKFG